MKLLRADRYDPKRTFRCLRCDPPPKKLRVARRYLFVIEHESSQTGDYCLPCASRVLGVRQGELRRRADSISTQQEEVRLKT